MSERQDDLHEAYQLVRDFNRSEKERHEKIYGKKNAAERCRLQVGDSVYLKSGEKKTGLDRDHLKGLDVIEEVVSNENVKLKMGTSEDSRRHPVVHVNCLKPDKADNLEKVSSDVIKVLDKMRTRNDKGWLETKYFVELENGETLWLDDTHVSLSLLEKFKSSWQKSRFRRVCKYAENIRSEAMDSLLEIWTPIFRLFVRLREDST